MVEPDVAERLTNTEFSKTLDMSSMKPTVDTASDITQISDTNSGNKSDRLYSDADTRTTLKSLKSFDENRTLEEVTQQSNDLPLNTETKSQLLLSDAITSASRSRKSQENLGAESLKTSRVPAEINENIMSSSILSELKNSNTSSNNSTERKTSSNEQNSGLNSFDPGRVQDIEASAKTSVSSKLSKNQSNTTSNQSSENIKTHQSSGVENALEFGVTQVSEKMHGLVRTVHATQLSSKKSEASQLPNLLGTNSSNNSTNKNSKTKETKEVESMAGLVRTIRATQISTKTSESYQLPNNQSQWK